MPLAEVVQSVLGNDIPLGVAAYDGSAAGPPDAVATLVIRSPDALSRIISRPGELGLSRAYVAGDLDIDGDIYSLLDLDISRFESPARPHDGRSIASSRGTVRTPAASSSGGGSQTQWSHPQSQKGPRVDSASLRRVQHLLRDGARLLHDVLVRGVRDSRKMTSPRRRRTSTTSSVASSVCDLACGCSMWAAAGEGWRSMPPRITGRASSVSPCRANSTTGRRSVWPSAASATGSRSASRTTATSPTGRSTRSARSACSSTWVGGEWSTTSTDYSRSCGREVGC